MIALVVLLFILAVLAYGAWGALHFLIWIGIALLILWVVLWFVGGAAGAPRRGYWRRW